MERGQRTLNGDVASGSNINGESMDRDQPRVMVNRPSISAMINPRPQDTVGHTVGRTENRSGQDDNDVEMAD